MAAVPPPTVCPRARPGRVAPEPSWDGCRGWWALALCAACGLALTGCAGRRVPLPTDAGTPLADAAAIHMEVSRACRGVRTLTAELALSGHAGETRLRGRVVAGFERPASMRLEGVAPFGPPAFVLAARPGEAVLLLPRDRRVLTGARAEDVLGALTGVALAPADLQAILTGCVVATPASTGGRLHGNGWASIDLEGESTLYLTRSGGRWQLRAATRRGWRLDYPAWSGDFPQTVTLRSTDAPVPVDVTAGISQLEANVDIAPAAFSVIVPPDALGLTLEELRDAGPLRGQ